MEVGFAPDADVEGILLGSAAMAELSEAPRYHVESLAPRDWVTEVQRNWPPIAIADALTIRFPWHLASDIAEADASLPCITLHPGMAFGTGEHETTQLCVTELQRLLSASGGGAVEPGAGEGRVVGQTVLDYGSGSGILAFAALTFGAAAAVGVEIDREALASSLLNARENGLARRFEAMLPEEEEATRRTYPLVVANILAGTLIELAPRLTAALAPGGTLLLSGIWGEAQVAKVVKAFEAAGQGQLSAFTPIYLNGWALILIRAERTVPS